MSASKFSRFLEFLELHENLLHAETQAIAAKHLDTIESLIEAKQENLNFLLEAKEELKSNPRDDQRADELIEKILELQDRNTKSFSKLYQDKVREKGQGRNNCPGQTPQASTWIALRSSPKY